MRCRPGSLPGPRRPRRSTARRSCSTLSRLVLMTAWHTCHRRRRRSCRCRRSRPRTSRDPSTYRPRSGNRPDELPVQRPARPARVADEDRIAERAARRDVRGRGGRRQRRRDRRRRRGQPDLGRLGGEQRGAVVARIARGAVPGDRVDVSGRHLHGEVHRERCAGVYMPLAVNRSALTRLSGVGAAVVQSLTHPELAAFAYTSGRHGLLDCEYRPSHRRAATLTCRRRSARTGCRGRHPPAPG